MLRNIAKLVALSGLCSLVAVSPAFGQLRWVKPAWLPMYTPQGCLFYLWMDPAMNPKRDGIFKWSGAPCKKGAPINGKGTLSRKWKDIPGFEGLETGRMVDGVFEGQVVLRMKDKGQPDSVDRLRYIGGCSEKSTTRDYPPCVPRGSIPEKNTQ